MNLITRIVVAVDRMLNLGRRDTAYEHRLAGKCVYQIDDYFCDEPAVDGSFCWEHKADVYEDDRDEWDDEDEPRTFWRPR